MISRNLHQVLVMSCSCNPWPHEVGLQLHGDGHGQDGGASVLVLEEQRVGGDLKRRILTSCRETSGVSSKFSHTCCLFLNKWKKIEITLACTLAPNLLKRCYFLHWYFDWKSCFVVFFHGWNEWKNPQFNFSKTSQDLSIEHNLFKWDGKVTKISHLLFHKIRKKKFLNVKVFFVFINLRNNCKSWTSRLVNRVFWRMVLLLSRTY